MPIWTGYFANSGSPAVKIRVSGPITKGKEFEAILDTGFTGFLSMPLVQAIAVGLILHGTTTISLADGSTSYRLTARGMVNIEGESNVGVVILEPSSNELLLGMAFLRQFKRALFVSEFGVMLTDEEELKKAIAAAMAQPSAPASSSSVPNPPSA